MITLSKSMRTSVQQQSTQHPQEKPIKIIRNNQWAWVLPSELTDDERRAIYVAAANIYGYL